MTIVTSTAALGRRLRDARRRLGLTQTDLAQRAGITQATVSNVERGVSPPSLDTILRLLEVLQLEMSVQAKPDRIPSAPWEDG